MRHSSFLREFAGENGTPPTTRQLYKAFVLLGSDFGYEESVEGALEYLADFTKRWGKPSLGNLIEIARRFAPGQPRPVPEVEVDAQLLALHDVALAGPLTPEESATTFALATLGVMGDPKASSALVPYLTSPYAEERWQAGFALAAMGDERALSALGRMLVEFIGPNQPQTPDGTQKYHFDILRAALPRVLADWGDTRLIPYLRAALLATVHAEESELSEPNGPEQEYVWGGRRYTGQEAWSWYYQERGEWAAQEHRLVYALGRLGAFGALAGIPTRSGIYYYWGGPPTVYRLLDEAGWNEVVDEVESSYLRVPESRADVFQSNTWLVHACCGFLEPRFRDRLKWVYDFDSAPELAAAVDQLLETQFGLSEIERRLAMEDYERADHLAGTVFDYERFVRQAQDETGEE